MLNFLSFLVLLYVSGHFQQKKFSKYFRLIENFWPVINSCCLFWTWKFYKCFSKIGGKFKFFQKCWISWVFWFYFMFQDISSKKNFFKIFQTDRKILTCHLVCCNFSKSQGGKIQTLLELSYHSHLKKEGMTAAIAGHRRRGGCSKPYAENISFL